MVFFSDSLCSYFHTPEYPNFKHFLPFESSKSGDIIATSKQKRIFSDSSQSVPISDSETKKEKRGGKRFDTSLEVRLAEHSEGAATKHEDGSRRGGEEEGEDHDTGSTDAPQKRPKTVAFLLNSDVSSSLLSDESIPSDSSTLDVEHLCSSPHSFAHQEKAKTKSGTVMMSPDVPLESGQSDAEAKLFCVLSRDPLQQARVFQVGERV